jgi:hypothetical protein
MFYIRLLQCCRVLPRSLSTRTGPVAKWVATAHSSVAPAGLSRQAQEYGTGTSCELGHPMVSELWAADGGTTAGRPGYRAPADGGSIRAPILLNVDCICFFGCIGVERLFGCRVAQA